MATIGVFAIIFDEQDRVLCVRVTYGNRRWTNPGGRIEPGESPLAALKREVREETGYLIEPEELVGAYAKPYEDDLVLSFTARITGSVPWEPDEEIAETGFFHRHNLPQPMTLAARTRIIDAYERKRGVYRVFETPADSARP